MATIITLLVQLFGPMLVKWILDKWFKKLLQESAEGMSDSGDHETMTRKLLDKAIKKTSRARPFKRALLRHMRDVAPALVGANATKLSTAVEKELSALASKAEK